MQTYRSKPEIKAFFSALRKAGFKRDYATHAGSTEGVTIYKLQVNEVLSVEVQIWSNGAHTASRYIRMAGFSAPISFSTVSEMLEAVEELKTRPVSKKNA